MMVLAKANVGVSMGKCHFVGALKNEQFLINMGKLTVTKMEAKI